MSAEKRTLKGVDDMRKMAMLVRRGIKLFLSDKMSVFLSILSPIIILLLYVLFLGDIQMDTVESHLAGVPIDGKLLHAYVDGWMLAGVLGVACITVSFSAQTIMIGDRETGVVADMLTSPIKRSVLSASYFICNLVITLIIVFIVAAIALIYLGATGWYLSAKDVGELIGVILASSAAASLLSSVICTFIRTQSAHGALTGILSAAIGFFIGAYMPISIFPKGVQYVALFLNGSYSAGIFRNVLMRGASAEIAAVSPIAASELEKAFSMTLDGFGNTLGKKEMWLVLCGYLVLLAIAFGVVFTVAAKSKNFITFGAKSRKRA